MTTRLRLQDDDHYENQALTVRGSGSALNVRHLNNQAPPPASQEADDVLFVMQYLRILWKHKWVLLLSLVLGGLVGVGISLYTTPMYSSSATMEIPNATEPFS